MKKPVILIPVSRSREVMAGYRLGSDYADRVAAAGGLPVILPVTPGFDEAMAAAWLDAADGLLIPGGVDSDPALYGEMPHKAVRGIDRELDDAQLLLLAGADARGLPVLGICRGMQLLCIADGGRLWQDIPAECPQAHCHYQDAAAGREQRIHCVKTAPGSVLRQILGEECRVNSFHHQAVKTPGKALRITAESADGMAEALESADGRVIGVQWHPENLAGRYAEQQKIFAYFVQKCQNV